MVQSLEVPGVVVGDPFLDVLTSFLYWVAQAGKEMVCEYLPSLVPGSGSMNRLSLRFVSHNQCVSYM
jgi:hypothetical protein